MQQAKFNLVSIIIEPKVQIRDSHLTFLVDILKQDEWHPLFFCKKHVFVGYNGIMQDV